MLHYNLIYIHILYFKIKIIEFYNEKKKRSLIFKILMSIINNDICNSNYMNYKIYKIVIF